MNLGNQKRRRSERVAPLELPPGRLRQTLGNLRRGDVLLRLFWCLLAAVTMWATTGLWRPPFAERTGYVPQRDLTARVDFERLDRAATEDAKRRAASEVAAVYTHDAGKLKEVQDALMDKVFQVAAAESFDKADKDVWRQFLLEKENLGANEPQAFERFKETLSHDPDLARTRRAVEFAFEEFRDTGLLESLEHQLNEGSQSEIMVKRLGDTEPPKRVKVSEVRIAEIAEQLHHRITDGLAAAQMMNNEGNVEVAARLYAWLRPRLPTTLILDRAATQVAAKAAKESVQPVMQRFSQGEPLPGLDAGIPLDEEDLKLLRDEHNALIAAQTLEDKTEQTLADFGMFLALFLLCGIYVAFRDPRLLSDHRQLGVMLAFVVFTVAAMWVSARDQWRAELAPLLLFSMTLAIARRQEIALLFSAAVSLIAAISLGQALSEFVIYCATAASSIVLLGRVRSRTKLVYVGVAAGVVAALTTLGVSILRGQPLAMPLVTHALWNGFAATLAGVLITGLLPFIEWVFDIQTEISLLELGDVAHPVLQQLVRRAPGTYNHSINVASIAEAAAESIGANGLLCRVGAYFHDIGKMLKPSYFVENQSEGGNRHAALNPAMSSLVIIAHVKDGAELARQHGLPRRIIDFIEQHHGTTLVEFFYKQAKDISENNPDFGAVDESSFRYPGPKPQTKEAAVMMLADAVESASRTLVDPTPARIESLVEQLAMKRLMDGQFDECDLTFQELRAIQNSLIKSLTAVYHSRVKYPSQQTA